VCLCASHFAVWCSLSPASITPQPGGATGSRRRSRDMAAHLAQRLPDTPATASITLLAPGAIWLV